MNHRLTFLTCLLLSTLTVADASTSFTDRYGKPLRTGLPGETMIARMVPLEEVSPWVILATLAAEDKRFFSHSGVDIQANIRALWQDARHGHIVSGGSTVTQQLVRLMDPHPKTFLGKLKEAAEALRLERRSSKHDILQAYLNDVSYGNRAQGIEAAAQMYFGVPSHDLSIAQAALLSGIPKSPTSYEPLRHWAHAVSRQHVILERMKTWGWLSDDEYRLALSEDVRVTLAPAPWIAPHFTEYLWTQGITQTQAQKSSAPIRTTLDASLQTDLQALVAEHIGRLHEMHVTNGALVVIDNASGDVLAWVGSADYRDELHQGQVDGVTALRQPGSALKPFLYARAFSDGMTPADMLMDEPLFLHGYMPRNYDDTFHGPVRAREALACSLNVPAILVAQRVGLSRVLDTFHAFGLASLTHPADYYGPGLVLGDGEVSLLELTNAYATLARRGLWAPVRLTENQTTGAPLHQAMDVDSVYLVSDILSDNTARARAFGINSPFHLPFPFAAKTGTTKDFHDNWALGYTPDWTIGVWVGNFDSKPMHGTSGITGAGPLLHDAAIIMNERYGSRPFTRPSTIRELEICPESGELASLACPTSITDVFSVKHLPSISCHLHPMDGVSPAQAAPRSSRIPDIQFPSSGDIFKIDPRAPRESQMIQLKAKIDPSASRVHWWVDHQELSTENRMAWWALDPGQHTVKVTAETPEGLVSAPVVHFLVVR